MDIYQTKNKIEMLSYNITTEAGDNLIIIKKSDAMEILADLASESNDIHNVSDRVFTFDQMMDVITEFSDNVNTNRFYTSGYELKAELIPHIKASISILDSDR